MFYEECTIEEVLAYRELENEYFDFGEGLMSPLSSKLFEDVYYKMRIQWEEDLQLEEEYSHLNNKTIPKKARLNHYARKQIDKIKLDKLHKAGNWWTVVDKDTHKKRCYIGSRSAYNKKRSNKKVRKTKNIGDGGNYKKVYNYWWEVF